MHDFPDEYNAIEFESKWTKENDGRVPKSAADRKKFAINPQYLFEHDCEEDVDFFISLQQNDGRIGVGKDRSNMEYDTYPFYKRNVAMFMQVYELPPGVDKVNQFDKKAFKTVRPERGMDISVRFKAEVGKRYAIVCAKTDEDKIDIPFRLKMYFNAEMHEVNAQRIGNINERCKFLGSLILYRLICGCGEREILDPGAQVEDQVREGQRQKFLQ